MPQRQKPEVRQAILEAAAATFAEVGFERAALDAIVARAGTSIGNLYKYFAGKDELFAAFLPRGFPGELARGLRAQVEALRGETNVFTLAEDHPYLRASEALLAFTIAHRPRVVFLLLRAHGTRHERFVDELVHLLVTLALSHARTAFPMFTPSPANKRALTRIYRTFVETLGAVLVEERSEQAIRGATARHTTYHLAGLAALFQAAEREEA